MSELSAVTNAGIRKALGNRCFSAGGFSIDANPHDVQTAAAVVHCVNGVFQTDFAIAAVIDLSALTVLSAKDGSVLASVVTHPAKAAGDDDETVVYVIACKGDTAYIIESSLDVAAADSDADYQLECPAGYAPFGVIKLVRTAADTEDFILGHATSATGDMDTAGRTATFFDVSVLPATLAELTTV